MKKITCNNCHGKGIIARYVHISGGKCFSCNGKGYHTQTQLNVVGAKMAAEAKEQEENNREYREAREEKLDRLMKQYDGDSRLAVEPSHTWYHAHIMELAQLDGNW